MIFDEFSYIKTVLFSGDICTDVKNILTANGKNNTWIHVSNVAETNTQIQITAN